MIFKTIKFDRKHIEIERQYNTYWHCQFLLSWRQKPKFCMYTHILNFYCEKNIAFSVIAKTIEYWECCSIMTWLNKDDKNSFSVLLPRKRKLYIVRHCIQMQVSIPYIGIFSCTALSLQRLVCKNLEKKNIDDRA